MKKVTFTYIDHDTSKEEIYEAKWNEEECVWIGEDEQEFDTLDQIRTDMMLSGCKDIHETSI